MDDTTQNQRSGAQSLNVQINGNVTTGISYEAARQIAQDVFDANFMKLKDVAENVARDRAETVLSSFLRRLEKEHPGKINIGNDPDMQYAIPIANEDANKCTVYA